MGGVELMDSFCGVAQVGKWLPGPISFRPTFPVDEILHLVAFPSGVNDMINFVFLFMVLHNTGGTWGSYRLTQQAFAIWLYTGDVNDWVDAHRVGKA